MAENSILYKRAATSYITRQIILSGVYFMRILGIKTHVGIVRKGNSGRVAMLHPDEASQNKTI